MNIVLYGAPSSAYQYLKLSIGKKACQMGITVSFHEISSTRMFIEQRIYRVPAARVESSLIPRGDESIDDYPQKVFVEMTRLTIPTPYGK